MVAPCTTGDTSLSKGMVAVDEEQTEDMLLRQECRKVTWPTSALEEETFKVGPPSQLELAEFIS